MIAIAAVLLIILIVLCCLGIPIMFALSGSAIIARIVDGGLSNIPYDIAATRMYYGLASFNWVAIPLYLFLGQLMNTSGITTRLFDFALALVGHVKGGLGHVNVLVSMVFAGMSGSAQADAAGLGKIEVKAMVDAGYSRLYAATVSSASSLLGPILPPSIPAIVYATVAQVSVIRVFLAGVVPAFLLMLTMMLMCTFYAYKYNYDSKERAPVSEVVRTGKKALAPMLTPLLLIGGMYSGRFTATEAGAVGVAYVIVLSLFYRSISFKKILQDVRASMIDSGTILILIAMVGFYGWALARFRVPQFVAELILSTTDSPLLIIIFMNIVLLIAGAISNTSPSLLILVPILLPLANSIGMDPTVFGIMCILNLVMGGMTPPVGSVMIVMTRVAQVPYEKLMISLIPWYLPFIIVIVLLVAVPDIALWLPRTLGF